MTATGISLMHAGPNHAAFGHGIDHTALLRIYARARRGGHMHPLHYWPGTQKFLNPRTGRAARAEAIAAVEALREAVIGDLLRPEQHGLAAVQ